MLIGARNLMLCPIYVFRYRLLGPGAQFCREHGGEGGSHPSNVLDYTYGTFSCAARRAWGAARLLLLEQIVPKGGSPVPLIRLCRPRVPVSIDSRTNPNARRWCDQRLGAAPHHSDEGRTQPGRLRVHRYDRGERDVEARADARRVKDQVRQDPQQGPRDPPTPRGVPHRHVPAERGIQRVGASTSALQHQRTLPPRRVRCNMPAVQNAYAQALVAC